MGSDDLDVEAWGELYSEIAARLQLIAPDGRPVSEFLLHIEGDRARFRYVG